MTRRSRNCKICPSFKEEKIGYLMYAPNIYLLYLVEGISSIKNKTGSFKKLKENTYTNTKPFMFKLNKNTCKQTKSTIHSLLKKYKEFTVFCYPGTIDKYYLSVVDGNPQTNLVEVNMEFNDVDSIINFENLSPLDKTMNLYKKYNNIKTLTLE